MTTALLGDGHDEWHLAKSTKAVDRGLVMRSSDDIYSHDSGEQYQSLAVHHQSPIHGLDARCKVPCSTTIAEGVPRPRTAYQYHAGLRGAGVGPTKVLR